MSQNKASVLDIQRSHHQSTTSEANIHAVQRTKKNVHTRCRIRIKRFAQKASNQNTNLLAIGQKKKNTVSSIYLSLPDGQAPFVWRQIALLMLCKTWATKLLVRAAYHAIRRAPPTDRNDIIQSHAIFWHVGKCPIGRRVCRMCTSVVCLSHNPHRNLSHSKHTYIVDIQASRRIGAE